MGWNRRLRNAFTTDRPMTFANIPAGNLSILIVDNDPLLRQALRDMLLMWGISQVTTAGDGRDAIERLRNGKYDLLLTDWVMEPMDGEVLVRWVREAPSSTHRDIPIIVLTGNADLQTVRNAWGAGVDCVLAKPVPASTIARRIETVMSQPRRSLFHGRQHARPISPVGPQSPPPLPASPPIPRIISPDAAPVRPYRANNAVPASASKPNRSMIRLLLALDRIEGCLGKGGPADIRMLHALYELRSAASADPTAAILAGSLAACLTWSDPDTESYDPAIRAHIQGLHRFAAGAVPPDEIAALVDGLRAVTRSLLDVEGEDEDDEIQVTLSSLIGPAPTGTTGNRI